MKVPAGTYVTVEVTGTASSFSYPTVAGLKSEVISQLAAAGLQTASITLQTTILGSLELHYDVSGVVVLASGYDEDDAALAAQVRIALLGATGYQATATAQQVGGVVTGNPGQPVLDDPIQAVIGGAKSVVTGAVDDVKSLAGNIQKDVLILAGLVVVGIVIIAFSPQVSKSIRAAV